MTREALKLALEALEKSLPRLAPYGEQDWLDSKEAITAIKEALAQPEQEVDWEKLYRLEVKKKEALAAKYERDIKPLTKIVPMAQPDQEPVAWISNSEAKMIYWNSKHPGFGDDWIPLYTTSPPCQTCEAMARTVMMDQTGRDA